MINLAPITAAPQPASQSPAPAGKATGSEATFESIFDRTVAAHRQTSPQNTPDKSASPQTTARAKNSSQAEADASISQTETTENGDGTAPADGTVAGGSDAGAPSQAASVPGKTDQEPRDRVAPQSVLTDGIAGNGATVYLLNNLNTLIDPASIAVEASAQNGALVDRPEGAANQILLPGKEAAAVARTEAAATPLMPDEGIAVGNAEVAAAPVMPGKEVAIGRTEVTATPVTPAKEVAIGRTEVAATPVTPAKEVAFGRTEVAATPVTPAKEVAFGRTEVTATPVTPAKETAFGKPEVTAPSVIPGKEVAVSRAEVAAAPVMPDSTAVVARTEVATTSVMPGSVTAVGTAEFTITPAMPDSNDLVMKATDQFTIRPATVAPAAENPAAQAALSGAITPAASNDLPATPAATQHLSAQLLDLLNNKGSGAATTAAGPMTGAGLQGPDTVVSGLQLSPLSTTPAAPGQQQHAPSDTSPLLASLTQLTSLKEPSSEAPGKASSSPAHPSQRHAIPEQLLEAKIDPQRTDDGKQQQQQQPAKQEMATSPQLPGNQTSASPTADQSVTFSQVSQTIMTQQPVPVQTAPVTTHQPAMPPAAAPIYEESVLNQVAERFQMQLNNRETQLNIKLHPEELGKLDINLTVKEGSIRAHVVAQSGQVQEILEKNMTRLRALLEGQGFSIEELRVSTRSEDIASSDLFQDQLAGGGTAAARGSHKTDTSFGETFEGVITTFGTSTRGVNITA